MSARGDGVPQDRGRADLLAVEEHVGPGPRVEGQRRCTRLGRARLGALGQQALGVHVVAAEVDGEVQVRTGGAPPVAELAHDLANRVGTFSFRRTQIPLTDRTRDILRLRLAQNWTEINGHKVTEVDRRDGLKLIFEGGSWILIRIAGTEPKIRIYAEGRSSEERRHLMHLVRHFFSQRRS